MKLSDPKRELCALMMARGALQVEIASALDLHVNTVSKWIKEPEVVCRVQELQGDIGDRVVTRTVDKISYWKERFNDEIGDSVKLLKAVRDGNIGYEKKDEKGNSTGFVFDSKSAAVRMKAALAFLDRAPDSPKQVTKEEVDDTHRFIFEIPSMENIFNAAKEVGSDNEMLDILDINVDETVEEVGNNRIKTVDELAVDYES